MKIIHERDEDKTINEDKQDSINTEDCKDSPPKLTLYKT
jgi:hypothetical protein